MNDTDSMWLCPECEIWVGRKLRRCQEGHQRPLVPVCTDDVGPDVSWRVSDRERWRVKLGKLLDVLRPGGSR